MKLNYLKMRLCRSSTTSCIEEQYICVCFKEESNLSGCQGSVGRSVQLWSPFLYSPTVHFFVDNESIFNWLFTCSFTRCTACGGHCCEITLRLVVCGGAAERWGICVAITSAWTCDKERVLERIKKNLSVWNSHVVLGVGFSPVEFLWFLLNALWCYQRWCAEVNSWTGRLIVWTCICFKCLDAASIRNRFVSEADWITQVLFPWLFFAFLFLRLGLACLLLWWAPCSGLQPLLQWWSKGSRETEGCESDMTLKDYRLLGNNYHKRCRQVQS